MPFHFVATEGAPKAIGPYSYDVPFEITPVG